MGSEDEEWSCVIVSWCDDDDGDDDDGDGDDDDDDDVYYDDDDDADADGDDDVVLPTAAQSVVRHYARD